MKNILYILCFLLLAEFSQAHPVSYKGSYGIMPSYMHQRSELELNYSFASDQAFAVSIIDVENEAKFILPRYNIRLYRQNELNSQFNLYLNTGLGVNDNSEFASSVSTQIDYETRRIYTLLLVERIESADKLDYTWLRYRFGVAPYLTDFNSIHTWLIGQVDYMPELDQKLTITPTLRFFYQNYLLEFGVSTRGQFSFNGIFHF